MKMLALSDIQGNLAAVRKLRHQEKNEFDAVVVAGDIGGEKSDQIFEVLSTFECPVLYVYGNHDYDLDYDRSFGKQCTHLHMSMVNCGDITFTGLSGCTAQWGRNPIAEKLLNDVNQKHGDMFESHSDLIKEAASQQRKMKGAAYELWTIYYRLIRRNNADESYEQDWENAWKEVLALNREALFDRIRSSGIDPRRVVIVSHERLSKLDENVPGVRCHIFGHRGEFKHTTVKGSEYVNVSELDRLLTVYPKDQGWSDKGQRNVNAGRYAIIEIEGVDQFALSRKELQFDSTNWETSDNTVIGPDWLPGEEAFA